MATFILDDPSAGKLGGGQYATIPFRMNGEFRDIQFRWYQSVASQHMEPHFLEFWFQTGSVDESLPT